MTAWNNSIVVAGATGGLGPALCADLAHAGARLGLIDLDRERGLMLTERLSRVTDCTFRHGDLSVPAEATAVIRSLAAALGGLDAFVMVASPEARAWTAASLEALRHRRAPGRSVHVVNVIGASVGSETEAGATAAELLNRLRPAIAGQPSTTRLNKHSSRWDKAPLSDLT